MVRIGRRGGRAESCWEGMVKVMRSEEGDWNLVCWMSIIEVTEALVCNRFGASAFRGRLEEGKKATRRLRVKRASRSMERRRSCRRTQKCLAGRIRDGSKRFNDGYSPTNDARVKDPVMPGVGCP